MDIIISDKGWERTNTDGYKSTNSPSLREFEWKVKIRYFLIFGLITLVMIAGISNYNSKPFSRTVVITVQEKYYIFPQC